MVVLCGLATKVFASIFHHTQSSNQIQKLCIGTHTRASVSQKTTLLCWTQLLITSHSNQVNFFQQLLGLNIKYFRTVSHYSILLPVLKVKLHAAGNLTYENPFEIRCCLCRQRGSSVGFETELQ